MSTLGKQCILETHSEYLINRLRYLSAVSDGRAIADLVMLYFVEKDAGHSRYNAIRINEYGVIPDWPKGFFDENEENAAATLRASMQKRKHGTEKGVSGRIKLTHPGSLQTDPPLAAVF
jgi:predicted ATPase